MDKKFLLTAGPCQPNLSSAVNCPSISSGHDTAEHVGERKYGSPSQVRKSDCLDVPHMIMNHDIYPKSCFLLPLDEHEGIQVTIEQQPSLNGARPIECLDRQIPRALEESISQQVCNTCKNKLDKGQREPMEDKLLTIFSNVISPLVPESIRDEAIGDFLELHEEMQENRVKVIQRVSVTVARLLSLLPAGLILTISALFSTERECPWLRFHGRSRSKFFGVLIIASLGLMTSPPGIRQLIEIYCDSPLSSSGFLQHEGR
ncbi:MAG: hypothetical protein F6J97_00880 [Leptolyngbya sp. SIO4C1]|nr:hypothetical protein [Leptolyngbya sp. SIO4C1]